MREARVEYAVRRFETASDPEFIKALRIYARSIPVNWRTDTNEISYWLENFHKQFGNDFGVYGFYANAELVGFAELVHLKKQRIVMVDYVVIEEGYRRNNIFIQFVEHLRVLLEELTGGVNYVVAEVGFLTSTETPSDYSRTLIRLLKFVGFRVVKAPYVSPQLGSDHLESKMNATLMLFVPTIPPPEDILTDTFLQIVHAIYYDYYLPWYSYNQESFAAYKIHLDDLYEQIAKKVDNKQRIVLNGTSYSERGESSVRVRTTEPLHTAQVLLLFILASTFLFLAIAELFTVTTRSLIVVFFVLLTAFFALLALFSKRSLAIFDRLLGVIRFFRRDRSHEKKDP